MKAPKERNVCVITLPLGRTGKIPLSNLLNVFSGITHKIYLISGGVGLQNLKLHRNIWIMPVNCKNGSNMLARITAHIYLQLKILCYVIMLLKRADFFIFFIGGELLLVPMLFLKLMRKRTVLLLASVTTKIYSMLKHRLSKFAIFIIRINLCLVDRLIIYSHRIIQEAKLAKYKYKTVVWHEHFIDFNSFHITKEIGKRDDIIGYIGSFSPEKGPLNFLKSIPLVLNMRENVNFMICGNAWPSFDNNKRTLELEQKEIKKYINLMGWVPHKSIPRYLNEFKILVLPSYTEGLPNVVLEAMACGTPVLATPVGVIPNIIKDGETGFLLKSNYPKHIAERIIELLDKPELLEKVSVNAYNYVRENFSYEKTLEAWRKIFEQLEITN
ncbi:MAG: glycosyltransferase family 4 protein [Candidatus Baldrarchaeia archaeon]